MNRRQLLSLSALCLAALPMFLVGCGGKPATTRTTTPPEVDVAKLTEGTTVDYSDFTGRTSAVKSVTLQARATGYLDKVLFNDGDIVKKGQLLYLLDDRTYKAEFAKYEGDIKNYQAQYENFNADLNRARRMRVGDAISREEFDKITANRDASAAQLSAAKAAADRSKLSLDFTKITAPIAGKISKTKITEGNLVTQDQTQLTTIVSIDPIYADFDVDEFTVLRIGEMIREQISDQGIKLTEDFLQGTQLPADLRNSIMNKVRGRLNVAARDEIRKSLNGKLTEKDVTTLFEIFDQHPRFRSYTEKPVPIRLATQIDRGFPYQGTINFVDNQLDTSTGTLRVRGIFDNKQEALRPGLFVRVRLTLGDPYKAILVTERALGSDQGQRFLYVVNDKNIVEFRAVEVGPLRDGMRVIRTGVKPGERVIVEGLQRVRPGNPVNPTEVAMPNDQEPPRTKDKNKAQ